MSFSIDDIEDDNVNQDDYLHSDSEDDKSTSQEITSIESSSEKEMMDPTTKDQLTTQILELGVDKAATIVQLDDIPESNNNEKQ